MTRKFFITTFLGLLLATTAGAQMICPLNGSPLKPAGLRSYETFKRVPVLHSGRLKPMDTYARSLLLQFSGRETFDRKPAIEWLAKLLFAPETTTKDSVFLINNPDILTAISIEPDKKRRYSFDQLQKHYAKLSELGSAANAIPEKQRTVVDSEIIRVVSNINLYSDLTRVFAFTFPNQDLNISDEKMVQQLKLPEGGGPYSFLDIALSADELQAATEGLANKPQAEWTAKEKANMEILARLFHASLPYKDLPLAIVPSDQHKGQWLSPWDSIAEDFQNDPTRKELTALQNMVTSYWNGQQLIFDLNARLFCDTVFQGVNADDQAKMNKMDLEIFYNSMMPFLWAKLFYLLAFLAFLISLASTRPIWYRLGLGCVIAGFIPHTVALLMRIYIMARPPVSSLYETFIFVSFITVIIGLVIEAWNKRWLGIVSASISGTALLFIASKYSAEGDTMQMLVAVLNSNFWLGTHVLSITAGYGSTCMAGIMGHIFILQSLLQGKNQKQLQATYQTLLGTLGLALALTFLGTNLGGIWADQSWGRFWGWDPKENGALMIVLWCAILFHARIARLIGPLGLAAGTVLGMIVVMWAWFGVNLLSIGLHSYGFTSGVATGLAIYVFCEVAFLFITIPLIKRGNSSVKI